MTQMYCSVLQRVAVCCSVRSATQRHLTRCLLQVRRVDVHVHMWWYGARTRWKMDVRGCGRQVAYCGIPSI